MANLHDEYDEIAALVTRAFLMAYAQSADRTSDLDFRCAYAAIYVQPPNRLLSGMTSPAQFPTIESIELVPQIRNRGVFTAICSGLLDAPGVVGVCTSHVLSKDFAMSLRRGGWYGLVTFGPEMPSYYRVNDREYQSLVAACDTAFDERKYASAEVHSKLWPGMEVFHTQLWDD